MLYVYYNSISISRLFKISVFLPDPINSPPSKRKSSSDTLKRGQTWRGFVIRSKGLGLPEDTGTESFVVVGFPEDTEGKEPAMVDGRNELELTKGGNV